MTVGKRGRLRRGGAASCGSPERGACGATGPRSRPTCHPLPARPAAAPGHPCGTPRGALITLGERGSPRRSGAASYVNPERGLRCGRAEEPADQPPSRRAPGHPRRWQRQRPGGGVGTTAESQQRGHPCRAPTAYPVQVIGQCGHDRLGAARRVRHALGTPPPQIPVVPRDLEHRAVAHAPTSRLPGAGRTTRTGRPSPERYAAPEPSHAAAGRAWGIPLATPPAEQASGRSAPADHPAIRQPGAQPHANPETPNRTGQAPRHTTNIGQVVRQADARRPDLHPAAAPRTALAPVVADAPRGQPACRRTRTWKPQPSPPTPRP
jgi:hypothetical protein